MPDTLPSDWLKLIAVSDALRDADDATDAVTIDMLPVGLAYEKVLSIHNSWRNRQARCAARGLLATPFRIRRFKRADGGYTIEAVADLTPAIEAALFIMGDDE